MGDDLFLPISVVIPVHGDRGVLERCLRAATEQDYPEYEVLVVADRIRPRALEVVRRFPAVRLVENHGAGVSAARNTGAREARGEVVLFIDSDIELPRDGLRKIARCLAEGRADGVIGLISEQVPDDGFFSRFKNLWMFFTYHILPEQVALFYTSCAAIRRRVFLELGGFDENYQLPSVEDTDFGRKLGQAGVRIVCCKSLQVVHWKSYGMWETLRTDFERSAALVKHILRQPRRVRTSRVGETSVPSFYMLGVPVALAIPLALLGFAWSGRLLLLVLAALLSGTLVLLNRRWLSYLRRRFGWWFWLRSCLFIHLELWLVSLGIGWGLIGYALGSRY